MCVRFKGVELVKLLRKTGVCMETNIGQAAGQSGSLMPLLSVRPDGYDGVVRTLLRDVSNQLCRQNPANAADCSDDFSVHL